MTIVESASGLPLRRGAGKRDEFGIPLHVYEIGKHMLPPPLRCERLINGGASAVYSKAALPVILFQLERMEQPADVNHRRSMQKAIARLRNLKSGKPANTPTKETKHRKVTETAPAPPPKVSRRHGPRLGKDGTMFRIRAEYVEPAGLPEGERRKMGRGYSVMYRADQAAEVAEKLSNMAARSQRGGDAPLHQAIKLARSFASANWAREKLANTEPVVEAEIVDNGVNADHDAGVEAKVEARVTHEEPKLFGLPRLSPRPDYIYRGFPSGQVTYAPANNPNKPKDLPVRNDVRGYSDTFRWGKVVPGADQLALALLLHFYDGEQEMPIYYHKWIEHNLIAGLPKMWKLTTADIANAILAIDARQRREPDATPAGGLRAIDVLATTVKRTPGAPTVEYESMTVYSMPKTFLHALFAGLTTAGLMASGRGMSESEISAVSMAQADALVAEYDKRDDNQE